MIPARPRRQVGQHSALDHELDRRTVGRHALAAVDIPRRQDSRLFPAEHDVPQTHRVRSPPRPPRLREQDRRRGVAAQG